MRQFHRPIVLPQLLREVTRAAASLDRRSSNHSPVARVVHVLQNTRHVIRDPLIPEYFPRRIKDADLYETIVIIESHKAVPVSYTCHVRHSNH